MHNPIFLLHHVRWKIRKKEKNPYFISCWCCCSIFMIPSFFYVYVCLYAFIIFFFCSFGNFIFFPPIFFIFFLWAPSFMLYFLHFLKRHIFFLMCDGLRDGFRVLIRTWKIFLLQLWIHHRLKGGKTIYEKMHTIIVLFFLFNSIRFLYEKCTHIAWDDFLPYSDNSYPHSTNSST